MSNYCVKEGGSVFFHPGYYIKEIIDYEGYSIKEFADKLNISEEDLIKIIDGELNISYELANKLSLVLGTSTEYWLNLQDTYNSSVGKYLS